MKSNNMMYLAVAAGALLVLKSRDSGNGKATKAATATKNPAFTDFPRNALTGDQEMNLIKALFGQVGMTGSGTKDGSPVTPEQYAQCITLLEEAIAYHPNRPEKRLEQTRDMLVNMKKQILAPYNEAQGVGMGPIAGFSGVY